LTSEGKLFFEFELYARNDDEGDYEFNHTVEPEEFAFIAAMFGLNSKDPARTGSDRAGGMAAKTRTVMSGRFQETPEPRSTRCEG
jgi:hypothetical protein